MAHIMMWRGPRTAATALSSISNGAQRPQSRANPIWEPIGLSTLATSRSWARTARRSGNGGNLGIAAQPPAPQPPPLGTRAKRGHLFSWMPDIDAAGATFDQAAFAFGDAPIMACR